MAKRQLNLDNTLRFSGEGLQWDDIIIYPTALGTGASAPDLVAFGPSGNLKAYGFDGNATSEQLYGSFEIPHNYLENSNIRPHIHWAPSTAGSGTVKWYLEYSITYPNGSFLAPTTISLTQDAGGVWKHSVAEFNGVFSASKIGSICMFRLYRNPADDTYTGDAILLSLGFHYQLDGNGSTNLFTKD